MFNVVLTQYGGSILGPIAKILGALFNFIYEILPVQNVALCIVIFTFIVYKLMIPLTNKQQKYTRLSSKMMPEMNKITEKYKGKKDEASLRAQQMETQAIYEKYGASPTGGCLPMLISLLIMWALYRVMYAIPAYVQPIYDLYAQIAEKVQTNSNAVQYLVDNAQSLGVTTKGWGSDLNAVLTSSENINYVIDVLSKFGKEQWTDLMAYYSGSDLATVQQVSDEIMHVNGFLGGLNIVSAPGFSFPGIIIPILAIFVYFIQNKIMMRNNQIDESNPSAASMKMMNNFMPIMSGGMCLFLPIGLGIYWIAGAIFRILQQFIIDKYLDHIDLDKMIEHNAEKAQKKREKLGIESTNGELQKAASTRTATMKEKANAGNKSSNKSNRKKEAAEYKPGEVTYEGGSISSIANMLGNRGENKGE